MAKDHHLPGGTYPARQGPSKRSIMPKSLSTHLPTRPLTDLLARLQVLRKLSRAELSAMVACSALTGQLFATGRWSSLALLPFFAVALLAAGCSALNQWQEQDLDARMQRTRLRPLPSGRMTAKAALNVAIFELACGLLLLSLLPGKLPLLLGLLAIIWYNGVYTPLKRHTPFAALPGAICGVLPPMIGWSATGAPLLAAEILILAGTLFIWQIPHSWLLLCHYRQDLQRSGLPDLFQTIPTARLLKINNFWLAALGLCYFLFVLFGFFSSPLLASIFIAGLAAIGLTILAETRKGARRIAPRRLFHLTNLSMALLLLILTLDNSGLF